MGGSVAVGFRFTDGSTFVQERWTNNLPFWFKDAKLYNGDMDHVNRYIRMDQEYPTQVPLAPLGYGLVLVDYLSNHLLSMQHYTRFDLEDPVHMALITKLSEEDFGYEAVRYKGLLAENRLSMKIYRVVRKKDGHQRIDEVKRLLTGEFSDLLEANNQLWQYERLKPTRWDEEKCKLVEYDDGNTYRPKGETRYFEYGIDTRPLTYIDFASSVFGSIAEEARSMLAKLRELEIPINDEAAKTWEDYIKECGDEE